MNNNLSINLCFTLLVFLICGEFELYAQNAQSTQRVYRFDAGSAKSTVAAHSRRLTPADRYDLQRGYGWTIAPAANFSRPDLQRSRDDLTIDGVCGRKLAVQIDLTPGKWNVIFWLEAGYEDSSTVSVRFNAQPQSLNWQAFRPSTEGRGQVMRNYRVFQGMATADEQGLLIEWIGKKDSVRVMGFEIIADAEPKASDQKAFLGQLTRNGRLHANDSLEPLLAEIQKQLPQNPDDPFVALWCTRLWLQVQAEKLYHMRGWEWATTETGLSLFPRYHQTVMLLDGVLSASDNTTDPLWERAIWYRGRLLYWLWLERHGANEGLGAQHDLQLLYRRYPEDNLLAMYNGKKIDLPDPCDSLLSAPGAPAWSVAQREALCRMRKIIYWWVNVQQAPNGELGGKLGDDVEILRWWMPVMLLGDTVALKGWQRLAACVWHSPKVHAGYSKRPTDVEHSSEFISDTAPALVLFSDDSKYQNWLKPSADYFANLWTAKSDSGRRFFRSAWFSSTEVRTEVPKNRDLEYNTRATKAVRYLAWKTRDPDVIRVLSEWSHAWLSAAKRTDKNKPYGIIPPSVRFPDEAINGDETEWYLANMMWDYFEWDHHVGSMMMDQLLFTYTLTGEKELLEPLVAALELVAQFDQPGDALSTLPGSPEWAAEKLSDNDGFWSVAAQWRFITGNRRFDKLLIRYGTPYTRYRLTGDEKYLVNGLNILLENLRYNFPLLTSEVMHTDRVYAHGDEHLKAMISGDGIHESATPYVAVSWEKASADFTTLVSGSSPEHLEVQLFSHAQIPQKVTMRLWQLEPGAYELTSQISGEKTSRRLLNIRKTGQREKIVVAPQKLEKIVLKRIEK